jgi:voltage-gated potassium channel
MDRSPDRKLRPWQAKLHEIIFEADTPAGKRFDVTLMILILTSVLVVMLDSVVTIRESHGELLYILEWTFTIIFSVEYFIRLICVGRPLSYAKSFFGVIDLLAIVPTYISLVIPASRYLTVIRLLRVLRVFRVFKFVQFVNEAQQLKSALKASQRKIFVFFFTVVSLVVVFGSLMYVIEGEENGFTSIPTSIYWGIVTLTTVGYGDIAPQTGLGKALASIIMILGYSIIAVPTGIVTVALSRESNRPITTQSCPQCSLEGHDQDATFCKYCGARL